jgi:hypothetical protein
MEVGVRGNEKILKLPQSPFRFRFPSGIGIPIVDPAGLMLDGPSKTVKYGLR